MTLNLLLWGPEGPDLDTDSSLRRWRPEDRPCRPRLLFPEPRAHSRQPAGRPGRMSPPPVLSAARLHSFHGFGLAGSFQSVWSLPCLPDLSLGSQPPGEQEPGQTRLMLPARLAPPPVTPRRAAGGVATPAASSLLGRGLWGAAHPCLGPPTPPPPCPTPRHRAALQQGRCPVAFLVTV